MHPKILYVIFGKVESISFGSFPIFVGSIRTNEEFYQLFKKQDLSNPNWSIAGSGDLTGFFGITVAEQFYEPWGIC